MDLRPLLSLCYYDFIFVGVILNYIILHVFIANINVLSCGTVIIIGFIFFVTIIMNNVSTVWIMTIINFRAMAIVNHFTLEWSITGI